MKKIILLSMALSITGCAFDQVHKDPVEREISDCSTLKNTEPNDVRKYITLETKRYGKINIIGVGQANAPVNFNLEYANNCPDINIHDDVKVIEKIDDDTHKVTLKNGNVIEVGRYDDVTRFGKPFSNTPYDEKYWDVLIVENENGSVDYFKVDGGTRHINPFWDLIKLTVTDTPVSKKGLAGLEALKQRENQLAEQKRKEEAEKRRKAKEKEEERLAQEKRLKQIQQEMFQRLITSSYGIGRQICKSGTLEYHWSSYSYGGARIRRGTDPGILVAFVEGSSPDGSRLQIRMDGWTNESRSLGLPAIDVPTMDGVSSQKGLVTWVNTNEWTLCEWIQ